MNDCPEPIAVCTPCRWILLLAVGLVALGHILYVGRRCPVDLAEDEAYYWDWSRQLDYGYYSKGPLTPLLIRTSCVIFGDTPSAVRLPAILLRAGTALCTFWLTRRLFRSERLALGATLLTYAVPLMLPAGLVMTTDPPFLFLWGLACCLGHVALASKSRIAWLGVGVIVGVGFLAKFSMPLWIVGLACYFLLGRVPNGIAKLGMVILGWLPFTIPPLVWNIQHDWVTMRHVGEDVGVVDGGFAMGNLLDFWIGQAGVAGPGVLLLILCGVVRGILKHREHGEHREVRKQVLYLQSFALPVFIGVLLTSLRQHPSATWPMAAYFTFLILAAWFVGQLSKGFRAGAFFLIGLNLLLVLVAHRTSMLYPLLRQVAADNPSLHLSIKTDPTHRLHGWASIARQVDTQLRGVPKPAMVMAADYQTAAELAFYVHGRPRALCVGSYFTGPSREPFSQYDMWPECRLDDSSKWVGQNAIYLGPMTPELENAFDRVERLKDLVALERGLEVRRVQLWRCEKFKGMKWPGWGGKYNK